MDSLNPYQLPEPSTEKQPHSPKPTRPGKFIRHWWIVWLAIWLLTLWLPVGYVSKDGTPDTIIMWVSVWMVYLFLFNDLSVGSILYCSSRIILHVIGSLLVALFISFIGQRWIKANH